MIELAILRGVASVFPIPEDLHRMIGKYTLRVTSSQKLALVDALLELLTTPNATQLFIDCSVDPPVETNVTELLRIVTDAPIEPVPEVDKPKARTQ